MPMETVILSRSRQVGEYYFLSSSKRNSLVELIAENTFSFFNYVLRLQI